MGKLDGKKALITGGQRGLGFEIAKEYVRQGADIFICARSGDALQTAAAELSALKVRADQIISYKKADVSNTSDMDVLFDSVMQEFDGNAVFISQPESDFPVTYKLIFHNTGIETINLSDIFENEE